MRKGYKGKRGKGKRKDKTSIALSLFPFSPLPLVPLFLTRLCSDADHRKPRWSRPAKVSALRRRGQRRPIADRDARAERGAGRRVWRDASRRRVPDVSQLVCRAGKSIP